MLGRAEKLTNPIHPFLCGELLGPFVKRRREALGLTQRKLAREVGCSHEYMSRIEAGDQVPGLRILERMADVLQVASEDFKKLAFISSAPPEYQPQLWESLWREPAESQSLEDDFWSKSRTGDLIGERRRAIGLTQDELSRATREQLSTSDIGEIERGGKPVNDEAYQILAPILGLDPVRLRFKAYLEKAPTELEEFGIEQISKKPSRLLREYGSFFRQLEALPDDEVDKIMRIVTSVCDALFRK